MHGRLEGGLDWSPMFGDRIKSCGPDLRDPDRRDPDLRDPDWRGPDRRGPDKS